MTSVLEGGGTRRLRHAKANKASNQNLQYKSVTNADEGGGGAVSKNWTSY